MPIETIKKIKVKGKEFQIMLVRMCHMSEAKKLIDKKGKGKVFENMNDTEYCNAYVLLKGSYKIKEGDLDYPTYQRKNDVVGVDTVHAYNEFMTYKEKVEDAIRQIKGVICAYLKNVSKKNKKTQAKKKSRTIND